MTNEELATIIQAGERAHILTLWEQVRRFTYRQSKRWYLALGNRAGMDLEDFQQVAFLAILEALERDTYGRKARCIEAAASITGYDPVAAKELFTAAFNDALEAGYITDNDGDGISDQTVRIEYCLSADDDFQTKLVNYLDEKVNEAAQGTPFEGKIEIYKSAPYGNSWSDKIKTGMSDCVLAGWSGSALDPFGLTDQYVNPAYAYDGAWFDANSVEMTMTIDGTEITGTLVQWSDALNGATVDFGGTEYNFGDGMADVETRLDILAALEVEFLKTYDYLPLIQDGGMSLLTQQAYYVVEEYNPIMGRGGIQYLKYNYNEDEWTDYIAEQGGELKY